MSRGLAPILAVALLLMQPAAALACAPDTSTACSCCEQPGASCCEMNCDDGEPAVSDAAVPGSLSLLTLAALPADSAPFIEPLTLSPDTFVPTEPSHSPPRRYLLACNFRL